MTKKSLYLFRFAFPTFVYYLKMALLFSTLSCHAECVYACDELQFRLQNFTTSNARNTSTRGCFGSFSYTMIGSLLYLSTLFCLYSMSLNVPDRFWDFSVWEINRSAYKSSDDVSCAFIWKSQHVLIRSTEPTVGISFYSLNYFQVCWSRTSKSLILTYNKYLSTKAINNLERANRYIWQSPHDTLHDYDPDFSFSSPPMDMIAHGYTSSLAWEFCNHMDLPKPKSFHL